MQKDSSILEIILVQEFCPLKTEIKIVRFPIAVRLDSFFFFFHIPIWQLKNGKCTIIFSELTLFTGFSFVVRKSRSELRMTTKIISFLVYGSIHQLKETAGSHSSDRYHPLKKHPS